jgi:hypothetical protein
MVRIRNRSKRHHEERRRGGRLWRKGRERAGSIAEQLQGETIPAVTHNLAGRLDSLREDATPIVESAAERLPQRRRSRKARGFRMLLALALIAAAAVVVYLAWQRRDQEPAYLTQEPDHPMGPQQSGPGGGTAATSTPNGQVDDAVGRPYRYEAQSTRSN